MDENIPLAVVQERLHNLAQVAARVEQQLVEFRAEIQRDHTAIRASVEKEREEVRAVITIQIATLSERIKPLERLYVLVIGASIGIAAVCTVLIPWMWAFSNRFTAIATILDRLQGLPKGGSLP